MNKLTRLNRIVIAIALQVLIVVGVVGANTLAVENGRTITLPLESLENVTTSSSTGLVRLPYQINKIQGGNFSQKVVVGETVYVSLVTYYANNWQVVSVGPENMLNCSPYANVADFSSGTGTTDCNGVVLRAVVDSVSQPTYYLGYGLPPPVNGLGSNPYTYDQMVTVHYPDIEQYSVPENKTNELINLLQSGSTYIQAIIKIDKNNKASIIGLTVNGNRWP